MKNYYDESKKIICGTRLFLIEQFNACSSQKIFSDGSEAIDLFQYYSGENSGNNAKLEKVIGCILELEGFEEAGKDLSEKERIKELKELDKKIRKAIQEV